MSPAKPRVLFVDDDPNLLQTLQRTLRRKRSAWEMAFVESGAQALDEHQRVAFQVVVTDILMPGMNGIELVLALNERTPMTQCIVLTGTDDLQGVADLINKTRVFRFYTKPCPPDQLAKGIEDGFRQYEVEAVGPEHSTLPSAFASQLLGAAGDFSTRQFYADLGMAALNRLPTGVVVVSRDARVILMNQAAAAIISHKDGLIIGHDGTCRTSVVSETRSLHQLIKECARAQNETLESGGLSITRPSMDRPLSAMVSPLLGDELVGTGAGPAAIIFLSDPERQPKPSTAVLRQLYDLTESEARLVQALSQGQRLEDAADEMGITVSSARTYLKRVFRKTDTSRQAELVQLVLTSPVLIS